MIEPQHPITPPPELRRQWQTEVPYQDDYAGREHWLIDRTAQWGYDQRGKVNEAELQQARDQELEACCKWLDYNCPSVGAHHLRNDRRPKPPSLKEQALALLQSVEASDDSAASWDFSVIRRALKSLPD